MKVGHQESLPTCCGVQDVGGFDGDDEWYMSEMERSGTGLFTASFLTTKKQKAAFDQMCKEHKLLFKSPTRMNKNSGNRLYLCVFSYGKR